MDYEKAYKEVIERAKNGLPIDMVFPELKESEDEKIRKALINTLQEKIGLGVVSNGYSREDYIAWLEKQKEQKPEIKYVYPIFKVGDTIKPKVYNESHRIDSIKDDNYVLDNGFTFPIVGQDVWEIVEQKSIEDVVKDITKNKEAAIKFLKSAGIMDDNGELAEMYRSEQKPESGNSEKPNNHAEWSEEDNTIHTRVPGALGKAFMGVLPTKPSQEDIEWFKSLPERFNLQPNQEWNEEDEKMIQFYDDDYNHRLGDKSMSYIVEMRLKFRDWIINRFKFLCTRPKQEWSEKDENCYDEICRIINNFADSPEQNRELTDWLIKTVYKQ